MTSIPLFFDSRTISSLIEEKYKIKTKFKSFLEKNFPEYLK